MRSIFASLRQIRVRFLLVNVLIVAVPLTGISFARFYARRARRIIPAATVVIVATLLAAWQWLSPLRIPSLARDAVLAAFSGVNFRLAQQGTDWIRRQERQRDQKRQHPLHLGAVDDDGVATGLEDVPEDHLDVARLQLLRRRVLPERALGVLLLEREVAGIHVVVGALQRNQTAELDQRLRMIINAQIENLVLPRPAG